MASLYFGNRTPVRRLAHYRFAKNKKIKVKSHMFGLHGKISNLGLAVLTSLSVSLYGKVSV